MKERQPKVKQQKPATQIQMKHSPFKMTKLIQHVKKLEKELRKQQKNVKKLENELREQPKNVNKQAWKNMQPFLPLLCEHDCKIKNQPTSVPIIAPHRPLRAKATRTQGVYLSHLFKKLRC